jgi:hypothetical protein
MKKEGSAPNDQTVGVSNACSNSGVVQEALHLFYRLKAEYNIQSDVAHCTHIFDVLGRVGRLKEAEEFITCYKKKQKIEHNVITWMTFLGAYRSHMDVRRAERITQIIMDLKPEDASVYVVLSNIYAQMGDMNKREELGRLIDQRVIKKIPNFSTVEMNDEVYQFASDDTSHPNIKKINEEVQILTDDIIKAGYNPETSWVTRDIETEKDME